MCAQVTAAEAISTQWTHAIYEKAGEKQSASNFLSVFGPGCCGSMDKVRFNDGSTMCIAASDWQNAAECLPVSASLLARANRAKWTDVTCAELASTPGDTAAGMSMKASLVSIGTKCCGSLAKTRSQPACATGTQAPTPAPTPAATFATGSQAVKIPTTLTGVTISTFSAGMRFAYRSAWASKVGTTVNKVRLDNVRASARRRLATGVKFDVSINVPSSGAAATMKIAVAAVSASALVSQFASEVAAVKAGGNFADVTLYTPTPSLSVASEAAAIASITASPTPAPAASSSANGGIIGGVVAALVVTALALVAFKKKNSDAKSPAPTVAAATPSASSQSQELSTVVPSGTV